MSVAEKNIIATYNMYNYGRGLADFINQAINAIEYSTVHVMDEQGNHVKQARLEEIILENGSKVYKIVLTMDS